MTKIPLKFTASLLALMIVVFVKAQGPAAGHGPDPDSESDARQAYFDRVSADIHSGEEGPEAVALGPKTCSGGYAGSYPCKNVDLLSFMPLSTLGGGVANDIWGWTDPAFGTEYAILGRSTGTSFVDISDPVNPVYLGTLPSHTGVSDWRDVKIYKNRAYIVAEINGHGMQVFDLRNLRDVKNPPVTFTEETHYAGFGNAHNVVVNEETGFAYVVGSDTCSGGLHIINVQTPGVPLKVGCYAGDGYVHDAQCVVYHGPDLRYTGSEICFGYNEDTLTIMDVTGKKNIVQLARKGYSGAEYTHQGWLTEDHAYLLLGDEEDEVHSGHNTRTRIFSLANLKQPVLVGMYDGVNRSIDHNLYILDSLAYESNYTSGLQILDVHKPASGKLAMVGYFDTYLASNGLGWKGSWSNFPFFNSGVVIVSSINEGLFILRPVAQAVLGRSDLAAFQPPDHVSRHILTVSNGGIGKLNWTVKEGCDSGVDTAWLKLLTDSGQSTPDARSSAVFEIDSTGISSGKLEAEICLYSNDPNKPMIRLPVSLSIVDWPALHLPTAARP